MIDQTILNAFLVALISGISGLLGAWALSWKRKSETTAHVEKSEADSKGELITAILELAQGMNENNKQAGIERQQTLMAIERSGGRTEGMMAVLVEHTKSVKDLVLEIDEFGGRLQHLPQIKSDIGEIKTSMAPLSALETNLGETFSESLSGQLEPVVNALRDVETAMLNLGKELKAQNSLTFAGLEKLTGLFYEAKLEFMRRISPKVEEHIDEFLPKDAPDSTNGNPPNVQELPVKISIESASKEQK